MDVKLVQIFGFQTLNTNTFEVQNCIVLQNRIFIQSNGIKIKICKCLFVSQLETFIQNVSQSTHIQPHWPTHSACFKMCIQKSHSIISESYLGTRMKDWHLFWAL